MARFAHRANEFTFDSICKGCLRTIGTRRLERELEQDEKYHVCAKSDRDRIEETIKRPFTSAPRERV